jgi:CHASE1-domain containing sensor protein
LEKGTQEETAMGVWRNWFPIALAILWVLMAAMAVVDFASFSAATTPRKAVAAEEKPLHSALSQQCVSPVSALHD